MQKNNRATSAKVGKKAKKMGTPSPPKKKKSSDAKTEGATSKSGKKTPLKKIAVVAKKTNVGKKNLKATLAKKKTMKTPRPAKLSPAKVAKKSILKKAKPKAAATKSSTIYSPAKSSPSTQLVSKHLEKLEESDVIVPKVKKLKKSAPEELQSNQNDSTKTTAKKQNSKLSKKSNDSEQAVKQTLPSVNTTETSKDITSPKKSNVDKKATIVDNKSKIEVETQKPESAEKEGKNDCSVKLEPKPKITAKKKPMNKVVKQQPVIKKTIQKKEKKQQKIIVVKIEPTVFPVSENLNTEISLPKDKMETEKKLIKKEEKLVDTTEKKLSSKKADDIEKACNKEAKETIAKLLKEANKSILKGGVKKKRDLIKKIKTSPKSVTKKSKVIISKLKSKPKKEDLVVKSEPAEVKEEHTLKKVVKKEVKLKKKVTIKTEETPLKEELPKVSDNSDSKKLKITEEDQNAQTDDSTTSDELTLNMLRQTQTVKNEPALSSNLKKCEDVAAKPKVKKTVKIKSEPSSDADKKPKPKQIKKSPKNIQQKKKLLLLKSKMRKIAAKERKRSVSTDSDNQKNRKLKLYSWWNGPKRHRVASLNALAKVHCLYENESRGALYDVIKQPSTPPADTDDEEIQEPEVKLKVEPKVNPKPVEASTRTLRSVPGLRGVGKHWEMHGETSSSSSCEEVSNDSFVEAPPKPRKPFTPPPSYKQKQRENAEKAEKAEMAKEEKKVEEKEKDNEKKKPVRKRRNRTELIMDLKDMVVRKRMASLNASAILAASYSVEKKPYRSPRSGSATSETDSETTSISSDDDEQEYKRHCYESDVKVKKEDSADKKIIEVRASPNKKVAVILNQDTDVTITGVYVNSTTRSTHHEGYCSIAGMQYRISATSHTQTNATAVATETLLHPPAEHGAPEQPCKSYTPLGALSSMQPPGAHPHVHPHGHAHGHVPPPTALSPSGRRHGCTSAFSAPPPPHHYHPPPPPPPGHVVDQPPPTYIHADVVNPKIGLQHSPTVPKLEPVSTFLGYYQPAGPLITAHHGHSHPAPAPTGKSAPLPTIEASPSPTPPPTTHLPPPSSTGTAESSDNEVIITSSSSGSDQVPVALPPPAQTYRYTTTSQYASAPGGTHPAPQGYSYAYPPSQYYHPAPPGVFPQQQHFHHDICFPAGGYPPSYLHPKAYPTTFRRYLPPPAGTQYYPANPELYSAPPSTGQSSQVVSASSGTGGSSYQPPPTGPPPPTLVESYAAPPPPVPPTIVEPYPPPHYYTTYGSGPAPPACYSHSPPTRNLAFIDPSAYQSCPCPMQSCPKNVHTGPLTGDGKRSNVTSIAKESMPLPPVALALPLEPASVAGPPSPARGSAGMAPPPSPAGATYQPTPTAPKWDEPKPESSETVLQCKTNTTEKRGKARLGKTMVRNTINSGLNCSQPPRGMLLMCHNQPLTSQQTPLQTNTEDVVSNVKREVESPEELSAPPGPLTLQVPSPPIPQKLERIPELDETSHCNIDILSNHQTSDSKTEIEVQNSITEDCKKRLNLDNINQNLETQDCNSEQFVPVVPIQSPVRRKSLIEDNEKQIELPQPKIEALESEPEKTDILPIVVERAPLKRKLPEMVTVATENGTSTNKKQKTSPKAIKLPNGSYKDLIKKNNTTGKFVKIYNGKRKLISAELKTKPKLETKVFASKIPKIALAKKKATTRKRKNNNNNNTTTKEEPALKKAKTSKPLMASNLHNSKLNIKQVKDKRDVISELFENKEPVRKLLQKKSVNSNSKTTKDLNNVDRTIESVILNCATTCSVEDPLRTSAKQDSVLQKQVIDKQKCAATDVKPVAVVPVATAATIDSVLKQQQNSISNSLIPSATSRTTHHHINAKAVKTGSGRSGAHKRKSKSNSCSDPLPIPRVPRRSLNFPRWCNGWSWEGDCFQGKVFINSDEPLVVRKCYPAMRHSSGDVISPRDCVLLKAGARKIDLPFVAKVATLWEDDEGEMMMSLLWYYRPEHTDQGRRPIDQPDEVFASRHKDTNSVACIEDKCYVLTFNEYCRYRKTVRRLEENMEDPGQVVPLPEGGAYHREHRQPSAPLATAPDLVFFCRQVYDFRQKRIVKNPS